MRAVVADTSSAPLEVAAELSSPGAPLLVLDWLKCRPDWIDVRSAASRHPISDLANLDEGERSAIALAQELPGSLLLIDDLAGRQAAASLGIPCTGVLGVLSAASAAGLVDLEAALHRLLRTNFRVSRTLIDQLLGNHIPPTSPR